MTIEEAIFFLEQNKNRIFIERAIKHQNLIRFLTQFAIDNGDLTRQQTYFQEFLNDIKIRYNNDDAYVNFVNNITYPLQTNEFIEGIFSELKRVFQANDKYIDFKFKNTEISQDAKDFIKIKWFEEEGFDLYTHSPNTILITDLPETQDLSDNPKPYFYPLFIENVLEIEVKNNIIKAVGYDTTINGNPNYIVVIDSLNYLLLKRNEKNPNDLKKLEEINSVPHSLGKCPAEWLNNTNLYNDNEIVKASIISKSLGSIQNLLKLYTDKTTLDNYILPLIVKYKTEGCNYEQGNLRCDEGILKVINKEGNDIIAFYPGGRIMNCPICNKKMGVAMTIEVASPDSKEEMDLAINAITFKNPDTKIFEYSDVRIKAKEKEVKDNILGSSDELNPNQQQNALRVASNLDGKNQVFIGFKKSWENAMLMVNNNTLIFRYAEKFIGGVVNLGTQFFRKTLEDLFKEQKEAKELGLDSVLDCQSQIISLKFVNDPDKLNRANIILRLSANLRPYKDKTAESVDKLYSERAISQEDYILFTEFSSFIIRFEDEKKKQITEYEYSSLLKEFKKSINEYISDYGKREQEAVSIPNVENG